VNGFNPSSATRDKQYTRLKMVQLSNEEVLEVEPLEAQQGDMLKGTTLNKAEACEWVVERVKGFCHIVDLSFSRHEKQMMNPFKAIKDNRKNTPNPLVPKTKTTSKGKRELQRLTCSINYDGKKGNAIKVNGKGRGAPQLFNEA
jgi:hypothetical protein